MAVLSFFHNSEAGDRKYEAGDFAQHTNAIISDGVVDGLKVTYTSAYAYTIDTGKAIVMGRSVINDAVIATAIGTPVAGQLWSVVVRMDLATRSASIETILGTSYQDDNAIKQIPLATILVGTNTLTITDKRSYVAFKSGNILLKNTELQYLRKADNVAMSALRFREGSDTSGVGIALGAGGTTIIGGGESALAVLISALVDDAVKERLLLVSDYEVSILTGMQDVAGTPTTGRKTTIATNGDLQIGGNNVDNLFGVLRYNSATRTLELLHWNGTSSLDTTILNVGDINFTNADWQNLSLSTGISDYTAGNNAKYKKKGGIVYLKGAVKGIVSLDRAIATLPVGFRPTGSSHNWTNPTSLKNHARWAVNTDGTIVLENVSQAALPAAGDWFPIHTSFPVD